MNLFYSDHKKLQVSFWERMLLFLIVLGGKEVIRNNTLLFSDWNKTNISTAYIEYDSFNYKTMTFKNYYNLHRSRYENIFLLNKYLLNISWELNMNGSTHSKQLYFSRWKEVIFSRIINILKNYPWRFMQVQVLWVFSVCIKFMRSNTDRLLATDLSTRALRRCPPIRPQAVYAVNTWCSHTWSTLLVTNFATRALRRWSLIQPHVLYAVIGSEVFS